MTAESGRPETTGESVLDVVDRWYHVPALLAIMVTMFAIRMQSYDDYVRGGEVFFSGNDPWYHYRATMYTVEHWPFALNFDPWTYYPYGDAVGQFGTLFDLLVATIALVVGLGDPSPELVGKVLLVAPAAFGTLAVVPVYLIGERFAGRLGGLFGAVVLMLLPGSFLQRSLVGVADHNGAEPLFMGLAVLGLLVAFAVAERTMPIWEVVEEEARARSLDTTRAPTLWAALAGVLIGLYLWVWPPAIVLVGVVGVFTVVKVTSDVVNGKTPEPTVFAVSVAMLVTALFAALLFQQAGFSTTDFSFLHVLVPLAVALAGIALAALSRVWTDRGVSLSLFPVAILGVGVVAVAFFALLLPSAFAPIQRNLLRTVGFSAGAATRTIAEAQPFYTSAQYGGTTISPNERIVSEYGLTFFTALAAAIWLHARPLYRRGESRELGYIAASLLVVLFVFAAPGALDAIGGLVDLTGQVVALLVVAGLLVGATLLVEYDAEELFLVVWAAFMTSMAFTQVRFNYYLAVSVAVFNAILFARVVGLLALDAAASDVFSGVGELLDSDSDAASLPSIQGYQVLALVAVFLLVLGPVLAVPIGLGPQGQQVNTSTAWSSGNQTARTQGMSVLQWDGTFDWMRENTPEEGNLGGANNAEQMEYYGSYERTADHDYPEGSYGVMSWWDYGHWITVQGERIPNANPFQHGARHAANFLLAPSEEQANEVLQRGHDDGEQTRYVMVDWQMASTQSKFGAPTIWYDEEENVSSGDFYSTVGVQREDGAWIPYAHTYKQRYYNSTMIKLYRYHGSAQEPQPIVTDWEMRTYQTRSGETVQRAIRPTDNTSMIKTFDNMSAARAYVANDSSSRIGGVGKFPSERVPALEHYRLVKTSERQTNSFFANEFRQAQLAGNPLFQYYLIQQGTTPGWVKTFERVPGATVEGSGAPPNTEVTASVEMRVPSTNSTFVYTQHAQTDEDGNFELTLPYSTTGYDEFGPENGYTNVSVRANTSYTVTAPATAGENGSASQYGARFDVSEAQVLGVDESAVQVTMEERTVEAPGANETVPNGTDSDGTAGNETEGDANESTTNGSTTGTATPSGTDSSTPSGTDTATPGGTESETDAAGSLAAPAASTLDRLTAPAHD